MLVVSALIAAGAIAMFASQPDDMMVNSPGDASYANSMSTEPWSTTPPPTPPPTTSGPPTPSPTPDFTTPPPTTSGPTPSSPTPPTAPG